MHLLKILELLHILRNNPEPAEGLIAEAADPAFVVAVIALVEHEQYIVAGGSATPARVGRALVIVVARHWPRHEGWPRGVGRPHEHPQHRESVHAWIRNTAVAADDDHRVVIRHLRQELLRPEVGLGATLCSPQDHGEHVRGRLVAAVGSLIEVV